MKIDTRKIHFVGVGGIGMSALAFLYLSRGSSVSGSDLSGNSLTEGLKEKGGRIFVGHGAGQVPDDATLVVRSSCIKRNNPEITEATAKGIPVISRSELLIYLMSGEGRSYAVTGTNGKTTTSSLLAHIFEMCGKDPTVLLGGEVEIFGKNSKNGRRDLLIAEVDESDGFFSKMKCHAAIITNLEREHVENFGSFDRIKEAYREFVRGISPDGLFVFNGEEPLLRDVAGEALCRKVSFGTGRGFDVGCGNVEFKKNIVFDIFFDGKKAGQVESPLVGRYNVMNILAAMALSVCSGIDPVLACKAVRSFKGPKRRFDKVGSAGDVEVIEDYAHHPTAIKSVIKAAKDYCSGRVFVIFQPHRYSRTLDLMDDFAGCFYGGDVLILTDIYSAHEDAGKTVHVKDLLKRIDGSRFESVAYLKTEEIPCSVAELARKGDVVLVLGAGDISEVSGQILDKIEGGLS